MKDHRRPSEAELEQLYVQQQLRPIEIADQLGVPTRTVLWWLTECNFKRRTSREAANLRIKKTGEAFGRPVPKQPMYEDM